MVVKIGGGKGIFAAHSSAKNVWFPVGKDTIPNVLISTIQYSPGNNFPSKMHLNSSIGDDKLFVGTTGRGTFLMDNAMHSLQTARNFASNTIIYLSANY
jgi:hypothetical protein